MADPATADTGLLPRTYFRAPRVPLDLRALMLALIAYGVFRAGTVLLNLIFKDKYPVASFFDALAGLITVPYIGTELRGFFEIFLVDGRAGDPGFWYVLVGGLWTLAVFGFFGQGIHRITSLRIARDEGMPLKDALKFSASNFKTVAVCPIVIAGAIGLFYGCNALAGALIAIPYVGTVFALILVPLAMISSLLILLIAIGGVLGLPLVGAAAAWERNGSLDAISRAFSYIFARPLQFFWNYFLIFLFTAVILIAGGHFVKILTGSIDALMWRDTTSVVIDTPADPSKYNEEAQKLYSTLSAHDKAGGVRPYALSFSSVTEAPMESKGQIFVFWVVLNLVVFGIAATALWWFIGATTSTYADLRSDVDGTEEDEIYLEEEEQDFDALATPPATPPGPLSAPAAPAAPPPPPPPPPPPAPTA